MRRRGMTVDEAQEVPKGRFAIEMGLLEVDDSGGSGDGLPAVMDG